MAYTLTEARTAPGLAAKRTRTTGTPAESDCGRRAVARLTGAARGYPREATTTLDARAGARERATAGEDPANGAERTLAWAAISFASRKSRAKNQQPSEAGRGLWVVCD